MGSKCALKHVKLGVTVHDIVYSNLKGGKIVIMT